MNYDQLIKAIQDNGEFSDRDHARKATEAVLSVLGERLAGAEPAHLAAQLPPELAEALPGQGSAESFDLAEFDRRVAAREEWGCSPTEAHRHAAVVLETVLGAVTPGERNDVMAQLPADFADLLPASG